MTNNIPIHRFWLRNYPIRGQNRTYYRIALGELIPAEQRKTFPVGWKDPNYGNNSGSIGFLDVTVREEGIPKKGALPLSARGENLLEHRYSFNDYERVKVMVLSAIGIEPLYQGNLRNLIIFEQQAEKLAAKLGLEILVADLIENISLRRILVRQGFTLYDAGVRAVKRLIS